jgi:hypothetical protein
MQAEDISAAQLQLIDRARRYLRDLEMSGVDVATSALCYLNTWSSVPGYAVMQWWRHGWRSLRHAVRIIAKDILAIGRQSRYAIQNAGTAPATYRHLVVTWSRAEDFRPDGSFQDRYFNTNSREVPEALWFIVSLDGQAPEPMDANLRVFRRANRSSRFDVGFLLASLVAALRETGGRRLLHTLSSATSFARQVDRAITTELRAANVRSVILPYEAQPYHHAVFRAATRHDAAIRTVGYLHSALPPLPTDLAYRAGAPDMLLVHSPSQTETLRTRLGWPADALRVIPSLRYRRDKRGSFAGFIFFPYTFFDGELLVRELASFLERLTPGSLRPLTVRNHPHMGTSKRHMELQRRFEETLVRFQDRFSPTAPGHEVSVFVGATASLLEALERGVDVIHLCTDPTFESHSEALWPCVEVKQLSRHVFRYHLKAPGQCLVLGDESDMFRKYLLAPDLGTPS